MAFNMITNNIAKAVSRLTLEELCQITEINFPTGFQRKLHITHVFSHYEQCTKGSAVFITYYGSEYKSGTEALNRGAAVVFMRREYKEKYFPKNEKVTHIFS